MNGKYDWNYDNFEIIRHTGKEIAEKFMTFSKKTINFKEKSQFIEILMNFQELGNAIQNFIFQYVSII